MPHRLKDLAASLGADTLGDASLIVDRLAEPAEAREADLALAVAPKFADQLAASRARAAVVWAGADLDALGLKGAIVAPRGRLAMAGLTQAMDDDPTFAAGASVHPSAVIDPAAVVGEGAQIGPFVVIGAGAVVGAGARIASHVSIGPEAQIGAAATLFAGVKIGARVTIGDRFIAQAGAAIGGDGFSFTTQGPSNVERAVRARPGVPLEPTDGTWHRIHSLGAVEIGDDVEVGANATIDAGTIRATRVGHGVKIDNLVQVGHNVVLGEDCLLCAQAAVAGSSVLGARVILGGKAGVADNLTLGRDVVAGGGAVILSDVADGVFVSGHPAQPTHLYRAGLKALRRLTTG
ncbi:UDP-3-O-(3-hydroxymyristoyl)glucosamine N-acyltransferase [Pseudooctadecabacter jejudonensis]|uniref:UDP-3-O-acylglucosamine N-acyltransferase n=1 Tax=Pseudooctadecabacter jejudonensis TaxID=1391910 RepID=A0A1Y5RGW0_9RHOB|nr:UDP-3-O-(3-hydroxymyristoyl)glucosamine N-acyltransferase [Pseudooctadecabacter jejudonensis]SLN17062.1 UDP-3-O-acylglucosamine N-acyltransferase [Pseudooctadecabacter jejudonensis]